MNTFALTLAAISLFNGRDLSGWRPYINGKGIDNDPDKVFTITDDGHLMVSGNGYGYLGTVKEYADYRLTLEYRWCGRGYGYREHKAADSGILFHAVGEDGAIGNTWMRSFEYNILIGQVGNLFVVGKHGENAFSCRTRIDGEGRWNPAGRDVYFVDAGMVGNRFDTAQLPKGERKTVVPPEKPYGEWNRIELVCRGDTAAYYHNGVLINELWDLKPSKGRILLQTEGHGIEYRNVMLEQLPRTDCTGVPSPVPVPRHLSADERLSSGLTFVAPTSGRPGGRVFYYMPESVDRAKPTGLFVFLHDCNAESGEASPEECLLRIDGRLRPHVDDLGYVVAAATAPVTGDAYRWNGTGVADEVVALIEDAAKRFCLDRDRIILGGHGMGACGVYQVGPALADRLAGVWICEGAWRWMDFRSFLGTPVYLQQGKWGCAAAYRGASATPRGNALFGSAYAIAADELMSRDGVSHVFDLHEGGYGLDWEPAQMATRRFVTWAKSLRRDPFAPRVAIITPCKTGLNGVEVPQCRSRWLEIVSTKAGKIKIDENWLQGPMYAWSLSQFEKQSQRPVLFQSEREGSRLIAENKGGNRFEVKAENVTVFRIHLAPEMGDLTKPFTVDAGALGVRTVMAVPAKDDGDYCATMDVALQ